MIQRPERGRSARLSHDHYFLMLAMMLVVSVALLRVSMPEQFADPRPLWERLLASFVGLLQCIGVFLGLIALLASFEALKHTRSRYQLRRAEKRRERLEPILRDARAHATAADLASVARALSDGDETVRRDAFAAAYAILRHDPTLAGAAHRAALGRALLDAPGFARTLADTPPELPLLSRVTLGAKLGAGSADKRLAPPTSDSAELATWVERHRRAHDNPEIQISVGYDTGTLPYLCERSRFVALCLFVATTDLRKFQALVRRPPRDPNAAYGLVIRGDVVEVHQPGQARGHRLDYVFPLPTRLSEGNLAALFADLQLLNLGLLTACADDAARVLLGESPPWLDARRRAVAGAYRAFERSLVALLRRYDERRDPDAIHALVASDHAERQRAFGDYRLEECLYPQYDWVVPLYEADTRWDRLLDPLRAVEGMLLHQGEAEGGATVGRAFIGEARRLGYETARDVERALAGSGGVPAIPPDPFLDAIAVEATRHYLQRVTDALGMAQAWPEGVPDPRTFRRAAEYYQIRPSSEARREQP